ncbi:MAG: YbaB/EbfC family nucleoid-associated protein [Clostridia bacterium]|nr:YbaB/EbfC family nucleoid-associated protein [Clostridia bacterium]MBR2449541.1 YbaB/EbfC family nucleoid-associated protein [Clostridia bacterium]
MAYRGGFGGFGGGNQMQNLMKQAQKMQEEMQKAQAELEETEVEGTSGGGLIKVTMTAKKVVKNIEINPNAVDTDDLTMLEDLIIAALNDGYDKAEKAYNDKMGAFGGLGL